MSDHPLSTTVAPEKHKNGPTVILHNPLGDDGVGEIGFGRAPVSIWDIIDPDGVAVFVNDGAIPHPRSLWTIVQRHKPHPLR